MASWTAEEREKRFGIFEGKREERQKEKKRRKVEIKKKARGRGHFVKRKESTESHRKKGEKRKEGREASFGLAFLGLVTRGRVLFLFGFHLLVSF